MAPYNDDLESKHVLDVKNEKVKGVPGCYVTRNEDVLASENKTSIILYLSTTWRPVINNTPRPLHLREKSLCCQLDRKCGRCNKKKIFCPSQESNPSRPAHSLVSILT